MEKWLLASDYDGTFSRNGRVCPENIQRVRRWRAAGNLFGLVTGRDIRMSAGPLREDGVTFDFLVCNNGTTLWDSHANLIASKTISRQILAPLLQFLRQQGSIYEVLSTAEGRLLIQDFVRCPFASPDGFYTQEICFSELSHFSEPVQVDTRFDSIKQAADTAALLRGRFPGQLAPHQNLNSIDVSPPNTDKADGLATLLQWFPDSFERVVVIGDGQNDAKMIAQFEGYAMQQAQPEAKKHARGLVQDVYRLIDQLLSQQQKLPR